MACISELFGSTINTVKKKPYFDKYLLSLSLTNIKEALLLLQIFSENAFLSIKTVQLITLETYFLTVDAASDLTGLPLDLCLKLINANESRHMLINIQNTQQSRYKTCKTIGKCCFHILSHFLFTKFIKCLFRKTENFCGYNGPDRERCYNLIFNWG